MITTVANTTWLGVSEVVEMLGISRSKVQSMARAGTIPAYRLGKTYRFAKDQIEQWVEAQRIPSHG